MLSTPYFMQNLYSPSNVRLTLKYRKKSILNPSLLIHLQRKKEYLLETIIIKIKDIVREILWKWKTAGGSVI